jgi:NADP-dependent 3-hydroxy acid dehydrogenase YdfG
LLFLIQTGAAGVVGFGVCDVWLKEGETVFAVDNREKELSELTDKLGLDADH